MAIDINYYKKKLEDEKALLESELNAVGVSDPAHPADWEADLSREEVRESADRNIAADKHEDYEERHAITDTLEKRLVNVNDALGRIEDDAYGVCEVGGEEIGSLRLEANPAAKTCKVHLEK